MHYKLANVLLDNNDRFYGYKNLYFFSAGPAIDRPEINGKTLLPYGTYNFNTYFNSFSLIKWKRYTSINKVFLHLELSGKCQVIFEGIKRQTVGLKRSVLSKIDFDPENERHIDFEYPETDADTLAFRIITLEKCDIKNCYYYTDIDESLIRHVDLVLSTTTFKKESYIKKNVSLFKDEIRNEMIIKDGSVQMIVVDNARTLSADEIEGDGVYLFQNQNVGGSGGFARGMIEAKRLDIPATHVLIMDDDIELSAESIKRTHRLLSLVKDEYLDAFVSGAMFSMSNQAIQVEDVGQAKNNGAFGATKKRYNMNRELDILCNETDEPIKRNKYAAFWYCCIPMSTINRCGLPLPLFIRYDDAEYGLRCQPKFMNMNGINVWHEDFDARYSAFYEKYCGVRNSFIIQSVTGVCKDIDYFDKKVEKNFKRDLKKFNYDSAELILDGLEDYLKGPKFIEANCCEKILKEKIKKNDKLVPLEQLGVDDLDLDEVKKSKKRSSFERAIDSLTYNGQRLTPSFLKKKGIARIIFNPNNYPGKRVKNRTQILMIHNLGKVGCITKQDTQRFEELLKRYKRLKKEYDSKHEEIRAEWASHRDYLYSEEFWNKYLGID